MCGSLYSRRTRAWFYGAPVLMGMDLTKRVASWLLPWGAGASRGLNDMKVGATRSPGGGGLKQGVLRKELTWQVGEMAGRPACLRTVSWGMGGSWSPNTGQGNWKWDGSLGWSRAEEWCGIWKVPLMVTEGAEAEAVTSLIKLRRQKGGLMLEYQFLELP